MSKLAIFDDLLQQYHQFKYHQDPLVAKRLHDVQNWLKQRIEQTHHVFFNQPENRLMAQYFMNRLYGGADFDQLAHQIERLLKYAHKVEKIIPANAIQTGTKSVSLAVFATKLDEEIAILLLNDYPADAPIDHEMMRQILIKANQKQQRLIQLQQLNELGLALDKYMRSKMMYAAFKMCKGTAYKHLFDLMYDFIQEGFAAMKPLKSAEKFIQTFTAVERNIVEKVHAGHPHPFD